MTEGQEIKYGELMERARAAYHKLNLDQALEWYQAAKTLRPDSYEVHLGLARTLSRRRQQDRAYQAAERCVELDPQRFEGYATLGMLHFLTDRFDEAVSALKKALNLEPDEPEPHLTLSQVYADLKRFEEAQAELDKAREQAAGIEDDRQREEVQAFAGHVETYLRLARRKTSEATASAHEVTALEESNPHAACLAYSNLGIIEARARHYDLAIEYLERAYQMNPFFERAGTTLGRLLVLRGRAEDAVQVLSQVLKRKSSSGGAARYGYAMALAKAGRRDEALAQYRQSVEEGLKKPDSLMVRWHLIWLNPLGRYGLMAAVVAAMLAWLLLARPSAQTLTLFALLAVILLLQRIFGRRKR